MQIGDCADTVCGSRNAATVNNSIAQNVRMAQPPYDAVYIGRGSAANALDGTAAWRMMTPTHSRSAVSGEWPGVSFTAGSNRVTMLRGLTESAEQANGMLELPIATRLVCARRHVLEHHGGVTIADLDGSCWCGAPWSAPQP